MGPHSKWKVSMSRHYAVGPRAIGLLASLLTASACANGGQEALKDPSATPTTAVGLRAAVTSAARTDAERARDVYRHPEETLTFFGLRPDMSVIELSPGNGWYTGILGPVLAEHGKLFVTNGDPNGPPESGSTKRAKGLLARFAASPSTFGKVEPVIVDWKKPAALGPDGSLDMVLTFRNVHNWVEAGIFDIVLADAFKVLKSGGVLGVVEHRASSAVAADPKVIADTGYVPEAFVIAHATSAGFKLAARSEINANPKDTKDYAQGVWTLPPSFKLGDVDHAKYAAIGESDRMTLRFVKP
jgi:predicted methyltransferase